MTGRPAHSTSNGDNKDGRNNLKKQSTCYINKCTKCGFNHKINKCPAFGSNCLKCGKHNHFSNVCEQSSKIRQIEIETDEIENYEITIGNIYQKDIRHRWIEEYIVN